MKIKTSEYRAHPFMIFSYIKPFFLIFLFPFFRAVLEYIAAGRTNGIAFSEVLGIILVIMFSVAKWNNFLLYDTEKTIRICTGFFVLRQADLPKDKISTIEITKNPIDAVFNCVTMKINTEAGRRSRPDYRFKISIKAAEQIAGEVTELKVRRTIDFSPMRVAIMAAATSSAVTGMVVTVPLINRTGILFGVALEDLLFERLNDVSESLEINASPIVNAVTLLILLFYFLAFLYSFFKFAGFSLTLGHDDLEIKSGFFVRKKVRFKVKSVNTVCVEQNPLMRFLHRVMLRVEIGGYGGGKGERAVIIPSAETDSAKRLFTLVFPSVKAETETLRPKNSSRNRFFVMPTVLLILLLAVYVLGVFLFPTFKDPINFLTIILFCVLLYFFELAFHDFKTSKISFGKIIFLKASKGLRCREAYCDATRVGLIRIIKFPTDQKSNTCNIKMIMRSECADSVVIKHISYPRVFEQINKLYDL